MNKTYPFVIAMTLLAAGCEDGLGEPTGTTCPPASTLTYDSFGEDFMSRYCTGCHSESPEGGIRHGAPSEIDFDTPAEIHQHLDEIDRAAGIGPDATNSFMPASSARTVLADFTMPTDAERQQLAEWVACDAP